jgi:hypothetical protein
LRLYRLIPDIAVKSHTTKVACFHTSFHSGMD